MTEVIISQRYNETPDTDPSSPTLDKGEPAVNLADTPPTLYVGTAGGNVRVGPSIVQAAEPTAPKAGTLWTDSTPITRIRTGSAAWQALTPLRTRTGLPEMSGLTIVTTTNDSVRVRFTEIVLPNLVDLYDAYLASSGSITVTITVNGLGGLDIGSAVASTWYDIWVVSDGTTTSAVFTTLADPSVPAQYKYRAFVGSIYRDSLDRLVTIAQRGWYVRTVRQTILSNGAATSFTAFPIAQSGPERAAQLFYNLIANNNAGAARRTGGSVAITSTELGITTVNGNADPGSVVVGPIVVGAPISDDQLFYEVTFAGDTMSLQSTGWSFI